MPFAAIRLPLVCLSLLLSGLAHAAEPTIRPPGPVKFAPAADAGPGQWLRYPALSPDGRQIAFSAQGQLWVVPREGGPARLLVASAPGGRVMRPVWSPDGKRLAYAADTHGQNDVFVVPAEGGVAQRLTQHSADEQPIGFTPDGRSVLFSAHRMDPAASLQFPSAVMSELYEVPAEAGRRPRLLLGAPVMAGQLDRRGTRLLYEDRKGYEDDWRKHHLSPVARDVWLWDRSANRHRRLTGFEGEDRNPLWTPDERGVVFLSERSGSLNVWRMPLDQPEAAVQLTRFSTHPVRFLSQADDGSLCFGWDGGIYIQGPGDSQPRAVPVRLGVDLGQGGVQRLQLSQGATELASSPDGEEVAFVLRGEVFVASAEFGDTRRITHSAGQERSVSFSPDGRRLLFAGEQAGRWVLYEASLGADKGKARQPRFFNAAQVTVRELLKNGHDNFQPRYSPDGKEVAYLEDRSTLKVLNLASGATRTVMPGEQSYSYLDGDQWFDWSPDGRWLVSQFVDRQRWSSEVALLDAQGKAPLVNLTLNGYEDFQPRFAQGGQVMLWSSDRAGLHATGGEGQLDVFAQFLTREAFDRFRLDKAAFAQWREAHEKDEADDATAAKATQDKDKGKDKTRPTPPPAVKLELDGADTRIARLTPNSARLRAFAMAGDGETLYTLVATADNLELWSHRPRDKASRKLAEFPQGEAGQGDPAPSDLVLDAKGESGFVLADGNILRFKLPKPDGPPELRPEPVKFAADLALDRGAERLAMFEHAWRQTGHKLFDKSLGGVDWEGLRLAYLRQLPAVNNNHDFAELLSELLGELDVSHTGAGYRPRNPAADETAALGAFFDETHEGPGLKLLEVIAGGPLDRADVALRPGMLIEAIAGQTIAAGAEVDGLLNHRAGQRLLLSVRDPASGKRFEQVVQPIAQAEQDELLYQRWVRQQRALVDRLSQGRLGYVHVRGMDDDSYRSVVGEALGRHSAKQGLVVDTRFNGGGNLTQDLIQLLSGRRTYEAISRGQSLGWEPIAQWSRPSVVIASEANYSDAHLFPWNYQFHRLGPVVGMPVAGTGTAVWWETLQDDTLYFGIPQVGFRDAQGRFMEHAAVQPDIRVPLDAGQISAGVDAQTEAAVRALLKP